MQFYKICLAISLVICSVLPIESISLTLPTELTPSTLPSDSLSWYSSGETKSTVYPECIVDLDCHEVNPEWKCVLEGSEWVGRCQPNNQTTTDVCPNALKDISKL